jgi:hypothetical protein
MNATPRLGMVDVRARIEAFQSLESYDGLSGG